MRKSKKIYKYFYSLTKKQKKLLLLHKIFARMEILYQDNHLVVVNKLCSEIVLSDKTGDSSLEDELKNYLKKEFHKKGEVFLGVPHRLDRPVSGIVLFARTTKCLTRLNSMFQNKEIQKTYWAVVKNKPSQESATLVHYLVRNHSQNKSYAYEKNVNDSQRAEMFYKIISQSDSYFLLEIDLKTGRHHQIRCQLAKIGCPVKGDLKYGFPRSNENAGIHLHAQKVSFLHPIKKELLTIVAPPPQEKLWDFFVKNLEK